LANSDLCARNSDKNRSSLTPDKVLSGLLSGSCNICLHAARISTSIHWTWAHWARSRSTKCYQGGIYVNNGAIFYAVSKETW